MESLPERSKTKREAEKGLAFRLTFSAGAHTIFFNEEGNVTIAVSWQDV
jgi:hypothetical protein